MVIIALQVLVIDASADPTVTPDAATYVWREAISAWIKISAAESVDLPLTWAALSGRPNSTPANIDAAVSARRIHANATQMNLISKDDDQNLTCRGQRPGALRGSLDTNWMITVTWGNGLGDPAFEALIGTIIAGRDPEPPADWSLTGGEGFVTILSMPEIPPLDITGAIMIGS